MGNSRLHAARGPSPCERAQQISRLGGSSSEKGLSPSPRRVNRRRGPGVNQPGRGTEICTTSSASRPPATTRSSAGGARRTSASTPPTTSTVGTEAKLTEVTSPWHWSARHAGLVLVPLVALVAGGL